MQEIFTAWKAEKLAAPGNSSGSSSTIAVLKSLDTQQRAQAKAQMVKTKLHVQLKKVAKQQRATIDLSRKDSNA